MLLTNALAVHLSATPDYSSQKKCLAWSACIMVRMWKWTVAVLPCSENHLLPRVLFSFLIFFLLSQWFMLVISFLSSCSPLSCILSSHVLSMKLDRFFDQSRGIILWFCSTVGRQVFVKKATINFIFGDIFPFFSWGCWGEGGVCCCCCFMLENVSVLCLSGSVDFYSKNMPDTMNSGAIRILYVQFLNSLWEIQMLVTWIHLFCFWKHWMS